MLIALSAVEWDSATTGPWAGLLKKRGPAETVARHTLLSLKEPLAIGCEGRVWREFVNYVERGTRQPTVGMFIRLCKAMKVYPPDLLAKNRWLAFDPYFEFNQFNKRSGFAPVCGRLYCVYNPCMRDRPSLGAA